MFGQFVNSVAPGNFGAPGVYVLNAPNQQVTPTGPALGKLGGIGTGQWGYKNTATPCATNQQLYAAFGPNTTLNYSLTRDGFAAMPECNQFIGVRVTDGTDVAAQIAFLDGASTPGVIGTFTFVNTGSLPNGVNASGLVVNPAQVIATLIQGQLAASGTVIPIARVTLTFPNQQPQAFSVVCGTASAGYVPATFKANLAAAINVGTSAQSPSVYTTFAAGTSTVAPAISTSTTVTFTPQTADGVLGTDGASGVTNTTLIGNDGLVGRTGLYALRNAIQGGQFIFCGYAMASSGDVLPQTAVAFCQSEGVRCGLSFAEGTQTTTALTIKAANSAKDPTLDTFIDWIQIDDPWTGEATYTAPHAKGMGIISSLDYNQSPLNKPGKGGAVGVIQTEEFQGGINNVSSATQTVRYAGGLQYLSQPSGVWALASDKTSDGVTLVSDARAAWFFGIAFMQIAVYYLGQPQTNAANDPTRVAVKASFNSFMSLQTGKIGLLPNGNPAYSIVCDTSNNTPVTVAQGFLNISASVQTQGNAAVILVQDQVGVTVTLTTQST